MSTQTLGDCLSLEAAEAISRYQLLYINSSNKFAIATATSAAATHVATDNVASGDWLAGRSLAEENTHKVIASAAVTLGNPVYQGASGRVSSVVDGALIGFAMQAASAAADVIEVRVPTPGELIARSHPMRAYTADGTLGVAQSGLLVTNLGASGTVVINLPTGCPAGTQFCFCVQAAQALRINPGDNDAFIVGGAVQADGKYYWADDEGESLIVTSDANNNWIGSHATGTWTIEP